MQTNTHKCKLANLTKTYLRQRKRLRAHKLHNKIQQDRHAKSKAVHNNNAVPDKLKLEDILVSLPVGEVAWEVAGGAEEEDDRGEDPEWTVEIWVRLDLLYELSLDGDEGQSDALDDLLLADAEKLLVELEVEETCAACLLLFLCFGLRLFLVRTGAVIVLNDIRGTAW